MRCQTLTNMDDININNITKFERVGSDTLYASKLGYWTIQLLVRTLVFAMLLAGSILISLEFKDEGIRFFLLALQFILMGLLEHALKERFPKVWGDWSNYRRPKETVIRALTVLLLLSIWGDSSLRHSSSNSNG